ncbi:hypothetical protein QFZ83_005150 [Variovorax sp. W1I1]|nr:hypothetical protein [Variovorax sp. W1I1]
MTERSPKQYRLAQPRWSLLLGRCATHLTDSVWTSWDLNQGLHKTENGISYLSERNLSVTAGSISCPCEACAFDRPGCTM